MMRLTAGLLVLALTAPLCRATEIAVVPEARFEGPRAAAPTLTPLPTQTVPTAPLVPSAPALTPEAVIESPTAVSVPIPEPPTAAVQLAALGAAKAPESEPRRVFDAGFSPTPAGEEEVVVPSEKLSFVDVGGRDVYNLTAPFKANFRSREHEVLAARVEARHSEESETVFFEKAGAHWQPLAGAPILKLQDPFFARVKGELIVGGVETFPRADGGTGYRTVFYRGKELADLKPFAQGPDDMKDIRLMELPSGEIMVLTRPQGKIGGRGKIAMTVIDDLEALGPAAINRAAILEGLFPPEQWGGANELHLLKDGRVGVLGHIANFDAAGNRHYYPMAFSLDPATGRRSPMRILLRRSQLPAGASKRPDLTDVLFSGGLVRRGDGTAVLYVGAGDAEAYRVSIPDPFAD